MTKKQIFYLILSFSLVLISFILIGSVDVRLCWGVVGLIYGVTLLKKIDKEFANNLNNKNNEKNNK